MYVAFVGVSLSAMILSLSDLLFYYRLILLENRFGVYTRFFWVMFETKPDMVFIWAAVPNFYKIRKSEFAMFRSMILFPIWFLRCKQALSVTSIILHYMHIWVRIRSIGTINKTRRLLAAQNGWLKLPEQKFEPVIKRGRALHHLTRHERWPHIQN